MGIFIFNFAILILCIYAHVQVLVVVVVMLLSFYYQRILSSSFLTIIKHYAINSTTKTYFFM